MVETNESAADSDELTSAVDPQRTQQSGAEAQTVPPRPPDATDSPMPHGPGSMLGPYRLESKLGEGGMGAVYKATHTKLGKVVAVKVLPAHLTKQKDTIARFEREMLAVGKLTHPHIVQAHDAGEIQGTHFLAMEYVDGVDLAEFIRQRGPLSVANACKAVRQAALALAAAHSQGLIHRDIKPSNMLLAKSTGQIKLLDMGLARLVDEAGPLPDLTLAGATFGTPDYMAPEQWENSHAADARTDLYALGCTLFCLLTGQAPYGDERHRQPLHKMTAHVSKPIPDLKAVRPDVPDAVDAIYRKLLAKKPEDRFQSAKDLADALQPFSSSKPSSTAATVPEILPAIVTEPYSPPRPPRKKNQTALFAGGFGVLALLAGIVIIITNKDGTKTKIEVPDGTQKVEVAQDGKIVSTVALENLPRANPTEQRLQYFVQQREVAEFVLSRGGNVTVDWEVEFDNVPRPPNFKPGTTIPAGPFVVQSIDLSNSKIDGQALSRFSLAKHLMFLTIADAILTESDAKRLADFPLLRTLGLYVASLKTSWLPKLEAPNGLSLSPEMVDDQWAFVGRCPRLRLLTVAVGNSSADADFAPLAAYSQLRHLELRGIKISVQTVAKLQERNSQLLVTVDNQLVGGNPVHESARKLLTAGAEIYTIGHFNADAPRFQQVTMEMLQDGLPWRIDDVRFGEGHQASPADLQEMTSFAGMLSNVMLDKQQNADRIARQLTDLGFLHGMTFTNSDLTDAGLNTLQQFNQLRYLDVRGNPRITPVAVNAFHKAVPGCRLLSDHGDLPRDLVDLPERTTNSNDDDAKFFTQQREVTEFVLSRGGNVTVRFDDFLQPEQMQLQPGSSLPDRKWVIWQIRLEDLAFSGADLSRLRPARHLVELSLSNPKLQRDDTAQLTAFPHLKTLALTSVQTSALPKLDALHVLGITGEMVDDQWQFLERCPHLRELSVRGATIPDVTPLGKYPQLRVVSLPEAEISPQMVTQLQEQNPALCVWSKGKLLGRDRIAEAAVKLLDRKAAVISYGRYGDIETKRRDLTREILQKEQGCLVWGVEFESGVTATVEDLRAASSFAFGLFSMVLRQQHQGDKLAIALGELECLQSVEFTESELTDTGLAALSRLHSLNWLNIRGNPRITQGAIDAFHKAVPASRLISDHGDIPPDYVAVPGQLNVTDRAMAKFLAKQREVTEFVLSHGGRGNLLILPNFQVHDYQTGKPLPADDFILNAINLSDESLMPDDLDRLADTSRLHGLALTSSSLDHRAGSRLGQFGNVHDLGIYCPGVKCSSFPDLPGVQELTIVGEMVDDNFAFLKRCPTVRLLSVYGATVDLSALSEYPQLRMINIEELAVNAGVINLLQQKNPRLRIFGRKDGKWRALGHDPVATAAMRIIKSGGEVSAISWHKVFRGLPVEEKWMTPALLKDNDTFWVVNNVKFHAPDSASPDSVRELQVFAGLLGNVTFDKQRHGDDLAQELAELRKLHSLTLVNSELTDAGLAALQPLNGLGYLDVTSNPKITKAAIDAFHKAVPACRLISDHGDIAPDYVAVPERAKLLSAKADDPATKFFAQQREVAEFVLSRGGTVHINIPDTAIPDATSIRPGMKLPDRNFVVSNVSIADPTLTGADLPRLMPVPFANFFTIPFTKFNAKEEVECLATLTGIYSINVGETNLKTSWLPRLPEPEELCVSPDIVDDNWEFLSRCPRIRILQIGGASTPILDMSRIGRHKQLRWLRLLQNQEIDEPVVAELQRQNPLLRVTANGRLLGRDPVREAALQLCTRGALVHSWGLFDATGNPRQLSINDLRDDGPWCISTVHFTEKIAATKDDLNALSALDGTLTNLFLGHQQNADDLARELTRLSTLRSLTFCDSELSDSGLVALRQLVRLRHLNIVHNQNLTAAAVHEFHEAVPICHIISDYGEILPDLIAATRPRKPPEDPNAGVFAREREVARFILSRGGTIDADLIQKQQLTVIKPGKALPEDEFIVHNFVLANDALTPDDLDRLCGIRMHQVTVESNSLDLRAGPHLSTLSNVYALGVYCANLNTSSFPRLNGVVNLHINSKRVDDDFAFLKQCPSLRQLTLADSPTQLESLGQYSHLREIVLADTQFEDAVVKRLQSRNPRLRLCDLRDGKIQLTGSDPFVAAANRIIQNGGEVRGINAQSVWNRLPTEETLLTPTLLQKDGPWQVGDVRFNANTRQPRELIQDLNQFAGYLGNVMFEDLPQGDDLARELAEVRYLFALTFSNSELTDAGLKSLQAFDRLRYLDIRGNPKITADAVQTFHRAVPYCRIISDHGEIAPDFTLTPERPQPTGDANAGVFAHERAVAEFVLSHGGNVILDDIGRVTPGTPLPKADFIVSNILKLSDETLTPDDLDRLGGLRRLHRIELFLPQLDTRAAKRLARFSDAYQINLFCPDMKTSSFPQLPGVVEMSLGSAEMVDDQFEFLKRCPSLRILSIHSPADISRLGQFPQLRRVIVPSTSVEEKDLLQITQQNPRLQIARLQGERWYVAGVDPVVTAANRILQSGGEVRGVNLDVSQRGHEAPQTVLTPALLKDDGPWWVTDVRFEANGSATRDTVRELNTFAGMVANVGISQQQEGDNLARELAELRFLFSLTISNSDLNDIGLKSLQVFDRLRYLEVRGNPKITADAVQAFHRSIPYCRIISDHGEIAPDFTLEPKK